MAVNIKRAYEPPEADDGRRVLVDRVWPRGRSKEALKISDWLRDIAPSTELRRWFGHDPERWDEFVKRYRRELQKADQSELAALADSAAKSKLTLVYGASDTEHNQAVVLRDEIEKRIKRKA